MANPAVGALMLMIEVVTLVSSTMLPYTSKRAIITGISWAEEALVPFVL